MKVCVRATEQILVICDKVIFVKYAERFNCIFIPLATFKPFVQTVARDEG